jgi:hypothetical protein
MYIVLLYYAALIILNIPLITLVLKDDNFLLQEISWKHNEDLELTRDNDMLNLSCMIKDLCEH